ncbi:MAG TPA: hypothetical protein VGI85_13960 [Chthoniobacterales bacterium]
MNLSKTHSAHVSRRTLLATALFSGGFLLALAAVGIFASATPAVAARAKQAQIRVVPSYHHDVSAPLRSMNPTPPSESRVELEGNLNPKLPSHHLNKKDTVVQQGFWLHKLAPSIPAPILNFDGIGFPGVSCNCSPPDTNGIVGSTQYVQMVNEGFQVFDKTTGASQLGPNSIVSIWSGFGGACQLHGFGDPVVLYDHLANRWVITQFASATGGTPITDECIAVSTTSDATGTYNRYGFHLGSNFFDYPHLGVWPDAYYMSMNVFNSSGTAFLGPQAFAFDRAAMIAGNPSATFVTPGVTGGPNEDAFLPGDLDGSILPPAGTPDSFVEFPSTGVYKVWHFHADFVSPGNTTFTLFANPAAAPFTLLCPGTRNCVAQPGTTSRLDGIGDRLMFRLAYRKFGDGHESVVGNFTVSSAGIPAVRWFELRNVSSGPVTVFQESTFQPDDTGRWMGSVAMDGDGNIAVGYSASSSTVFPSIRYSGRLATDPPNVLTLGEGTVIDGTGSQTSTGHRWGDYSAMTVDPVDDHTFWYTNEYYTTTANVSWKTRIANFTISQATQLVSAVSRLTHGGAGTFDIDMPITGTTGVEDRQSSTYNIILTFNGPITSATTSVTSGTGTAGSPVFSGNTVTVPLTGLTDSEVITLTLSNINGTGSSASVNLGFLVGDSTADRVVNGNDVSQAKSRSGQTAGAGNFRSDLNLDGTVNANDASLTKSKSGHSIP